MNRTIKDRAFQFTKSNWKGLIMSMLPIILITLITNLSFKFVGDVSVNDSFVSGARATYSTNYGNFLSIILSVFLINLTQTIIPLANKYNWGTITDVNDKQKLNLLTSFKGLGETFFPILVTSVIVQVIVFICAVALGILIALSFFFPLAILFLFASIFFFFWILMRLSLAEYIVADMASDITGAYSEYSNKGVFEKSFASIKESWKLTNNRVLQMLGLAISLIGWVFLLLFTLGLAIFFVQPYFMMVQFSLYQELVKESFPNKVRI